MSQPSSMNGAARLADWGLIRASGADAATFLQGQLTQDLLGLAPMQPRLAGFCSAKGRLQATFVVWRAGPEEYLLACSADLLGAVLKRLTMFVLRSRCKLADASAELALWGLAGAAAEGAALRLPDALLDGQRVARALLVLPPGAEAPAAALSNEDWRWLEVHAAVPRIVAATVDRFVPQMVNLELVGGVSFSKGCYPGQEIVARSQYRGTLKRRGFLVGCDAPMQVGQELFHEDDPEQPAGQVVLAASRGDRHAAFVELKLSACNGGALFAGRAGGPRLQPLPMPYPLPLEQTAAAAG